MVESVGGEQIAPRGLLRVSAPVTFGESYISPLIPKLIERYPELSIDLNLTDRKIDMLQEGVDVVVRIGGVDDSNLIARQINTYPVIMCASPGYIEQHGIPNKPADLHKHKCIIDSNFRVGTAVAAYRPRWPGRSCGDQFADCRQQSTGDSRDSAQRRWRRLHHSAVYRERSTRR